MLDEIRIESMILPINSLRVVFTKDPKSCKSNKERSRNTFIVLPDGRQFRVSMRFWVSFSSLFNLATSLFEYFTHDEVFARLTERKGNSVRITMEGEGPLNTDGQIQTGLMLSCTSPGKPILKIEEARSLIELYSGENVAYEAGIVQVSFASRFPIQYKVGGSDFSTRFMLQLPIDGYGLPAAYLELQRAGTKTVISGVSKVYKTQFQLGKDDNSLTPVLTRVMETFNNEEGYYTLKLKLEASTKSWASFYEAGQVYGIIESVLTNDGFELDLKNQILDQFNAVVGNPLKYYGVTGANELSQRKARTIPVSATVFDLFNFVTEITTYYITTRSGRQRLNEWIGNKLSDEYDLEGTVETNPEFKDFFLTTTRGIINPISTVGDRVLDLTSDDSVPADQAPDLVAGDPLPPAPFVLPPGIIAEGEMVLTLDDLPPVPLWTFLWRTQLYELPDEVPDELPPAPDPASPVPVTELSYDEPVEAQ